MHNIIDYRGATIMQQCFICQKLISTDAKSCPNCGQPWPANYGSHPVKRLIVDFMIEAIFPILKVIFGFFALFGTLYWLSYPTSWLWNFILYPLGAHETNFGDVFLLSCFLTIFILFSLKVAISIIEIFFKAEILENDIILICISIVIGLFLSAALGNDIFSLS